MAIPKDAPVIDYPKEGETVSWPDYCIRITAPLARRVEVSFDQDRWFECRPSGDYWWYDWKGFDPGEHEIVCREERFDGAIVRSDTRHAWVWRFVKKPGALVKELMTSPVQHIRPDTTAREAARRMVSSAVGILPVLRGTRLVGVVTDRDIVVRVVAADVDPGDVAVEKIMTPRPVSVKADDKLEDAARVMQTRKVRRVPVVDDKGTVEGILSLDDFSREEGAKALVAEVLKKAVAAR